MHGAKTGGEGGDGPTAWGGSEVGGAEEGEEEGGGDGT